MKKIKMLKYNLFIALLFVRCMLEPGVTEERSIYYLSAFLIAEKNISDVIIGKMIQFYDETDSSTVDYGKLNYATVTIFNRDSVFKLTATESVKYSHPHVVQAGEKYSIEVLIPDSATGNTVVLCAETVVPLKNSSIILSSDTLVLPDTLKYLTVNCYRDTFPTCRITTISNEIEQFHDISLSPRYSNGLAKEIYKEYELTPKYDIPLYRGNSITVHSDEVHFFTDYQLVIANVTKEHYNLSLGKYDDGEWGGLLGELPVPEMSNVSNGGGIFTGMSLDTVVIYVVEQL